MLRERERARRIATSIVALAMGLAGLTLVILAIYLAFQGGGLFLLAIVVGVLGLGLGAAGFFFQLVPLRVDELADEKRAYDARQRGER
jgi:hypothetical protein